MKAIIVAVLLVVTIGYASADAFQSFSNIVNFKATMKDLIENPALIDSSRLYLFDGTISSTHLINPDESTFNAEIDFINSEWIGTETIKTYRIRLVLNKPIFASLFPKKPGLRPGPGQIATNDRALALVQFQRSTLDANGNEIKVFTVHELRLLR